MPLDIRSSTQFKVSEVIIVTKSGEIDVSGIFEEINIFDSVFMPVMSGNILITDAIGLSGKLFFDGSESILISISKFKDDDTASFKKGFRIYKQSSRRNRGLNDESYVLHFVSDELIFSDQQRINQSYESNYTAIVQKILEKYLKLSPSDLNGIFDQSSGLRKLVIPNLRPIDAIEWCAKRAVDNQNSPNFLFYENWVGYNFASLSTILTLGEILDIKFEPKNLRTNTDLHEMTSARSIEVINQTNEIEKTRSGVNAGKFIGFDPITRMIDMKKISYEDHFSSMKHSNEMPNISIIKNREGLNNTQMFDARKAVSVFGAARGYSSYIKKNDPTSISKEDNLEDYLFQRKAIIMNLLAKRVKVVMPGNFQLTSGFVVNLEAPNFAFKEKGVDNLDMSISGKYLIIASRHIIKYDKHETIIEIASSSSAQDLGVMASNNQQTEEMLDYGI